MLTTERLTVATSSVTTKDVFSCADEVDVPSSANQQQQAAIAEFLVESRKTNNMSTPQSLNQMDPFAVTASEFQC
jgi:hypothetical protein